MTMTEQQDGHKRDNWTEQARLRARAKADDWLAGQAARLDTDAATILEAVRRGWLPEDVKAAESPVSARRWSARRAQ